MAIAPADQFDVLLEIRRMYEEAELRILQEMAKKLGQHVGSDTWLHMKTSQMTKMRGRVESLVAEMNGGVDVAVIDALTEAYRTGAVDVDSVLEQAKKAGLTKDGRQAAAFFGMETINTHAINALARETARKLRNSHTMILRSADDAYRTVIGEVTGVMAMGVTTRQSAVQDALNKMADRGISGFVDRAGRRWDLASYAEMAVRTSAAHAALQGHLDRMGEFGMDLVIVSDHAGECDLCRPWEGKVLSNSGKDPKYPPLSDAVAAGLFHPGCMHTVGAYIEGITEPPRPLQDPALYEQRQKQRYNERQIRRWKKREAVAITPEQQAFAAAKVKGWQKVNRDFVASHSLVRRYDRERVRVGKAGVATTAGGPSAASLT